MEETSQLEEHAIQLRKLGSAIYECLPQELKDRGAPTTQLLSHLLFKLLWAQCMFYILFIHCAAGQIGDPSWRRPG